MKLANNENNKSTYYLSEKSIDQAYAALNKQLKLEKPATAEKTPAKPTKLKVVDILVDAYAMVSPEPYHGAYRGAIHTQVSIYSTRAECDTTSLVPCRKTGSIKLEAAGISGRLLFCMRPDLREVFELDFNSVRSLLLAMLFTSVLSRV